MEVIAKLRLIEWKNSASSKKEGDKYVDCIKHTLTFIPVADNSPENKLFWEATPSGKLELGMVNEEAVKGFEMLKEYYVTIRPAE